MEESGSALPHPRLRAEAPARLLLPPHPGVPAPQSPWVRGPGRDSPSTKRLQIPGSSKTTSSLGLAPPRGGCSSLPC